MNEMVYQATRLNPPVVLESGEYKGYNYYVLSLGTHPCGYVEIPSESKYFNVDYDNIPVECHGGLTYGRGFYIQSQMLMIIDTLSAGTTLTTVILSDMI